MKSDSDRIRDQLLVLRCRRGDREAWHEIIERWQARLFYYIRRLLPGEADAWDVLQQTWMGAYEGIDGLKSDGQLAPWLYRIARNKSIDHRRKLRIHEPLDDIADEIADDSPAPPDEQTTFDNVESIHRVLDCLSLSHREVLTLFFLQDLSVNAIAQLLAVPPGTVKSRLHHAKRALRTVLGLEREQ